ncbi:type II secretion system protein GspD [Pseudosulfitobacter pseudonitzschiae]|uniref:type II secretion system protein GspD n=1 Tax=Pseudosulfitobacter pseudonitzschiae TaxID=1402135 RepID=UPI003B7B685E
MRKTLLKLSILTCSVAMLSACMFDDIPASEQTQNSLNKTDAARAMMGNRSSLRSGAVQVSDGVFMASTREDVSKGLNLPKRFLEPGAITFTSREALPLSSILRRLTDITGIPHTASFGASGISVSSGGEPGEASEEATGNFINAATGGQVMRLNARDTLPDLLNKVSNHFSLDWNHEGNRIVFRDMVTKQYQISALSTSQSGSSSVGDVSSTSTVDVYKDIVDGLAGLVSETAKMSMGDSTGTLTVTASVDDHAKVRKYIDQMNGMLNKQIAFDVNVLTVSLNKSRTTGLDISSALINSMGVSPGESSVSLGANFGSVSLGVSSGDVSVAALAQALSQQGEVSVDTRAGVTTSNNRMVPVEVVDEISYVASISVETDDNGNERFVPQPETEDIGFKLQLFPRILNNREIMVQYSVNISELNELTSFGSGSSQVQLPNVSQTAFDQQAILASGQTLILAGFDRKRAEVDGTRGLFTRGQEKSMERISTVIMITPQILNRKRPIFSE